MVYFFYPETAYRSLEEMDTIFHKAEGNKGWFSVVKIAKEEPHRYGKKGELLIDYEQTDERRRSSVRRASLSGSEKGMGRNYAEDRYS